MRRNPLTRSEGNPNLRRTIKQEIFLRNLRESDAKWNHKQ